MLRIVLALVFSVLAQLSLAQTATTAPNYDSWGQLASSAETTLSESDPSDSYLTNLRDAVVRWRQQFFDQQDVNSNRIQTLNEQLLALGPAPEEGASEPDEIAARRADLQDQLQQAEAPRIRAVEALRRADGIIAEIDDILNQRDRDALFERVPSPISPTAFGLAYDALSETVVETWRGVDVALATPANRQQASENAPLIVVLLAIGLVLLFKSRSVVGRFLGRVTSDERVHTPGLLGLIVSLGQVVLPVAGMYLIAHALRLTTFYGTRGEALIDAAPDLALVFFAARWIAGRVMPAEPNLPKLVPVPDDKLAVGRFWVGVLAFALIGSMLMIEFGFLDDYPLDIEATLDFPWNLIAAVGLFALGRIFMKPEPRPEGAEVPTSKLAFDQRRILSLLGRLLLATSVASVVLSALGYYAITEFLTYSVIQTLGIIGIVLVLHQAVRDVADFLVGAGNASNALWPVLVNFAIALGSIPFIALQWGATTDDLSDLWRNFNEGVSLGDTQLSPTTFLLLIFVFALGFLFTRIVQSAFRNSILPRTNIEQGGRVAIVSGLGYVGVFVSALIAISSAGLDLSSLAIVAGALSVGIGFGLQNIVSNFVSGIILLIERPIGEGDWIEVGGNMGIVKDISVRSTRIETFDRTDVIVPNADLVSGTVTNYTRGNTVGRIIVTVGAAYGSDTRKVEQVLKDIAEAHPLIMMNPAPFIVFAGFGADSLDFEIRAILRDISNGMTVKNELRHQIAERFAAEGIEIPFMQRDIWIKNPEALMPPEKPE